MDYRALGKRIRENRMSFHWTQENLADRAGISASFLGHIERGSRKASLETFISIANALHSGTDRLLADSLHDSSMDRLIGHLDPNARRTMAEMLQILVEILRV